MLKVIIIFISFFFINIIDCKACAINFIVFEKDKIKLKKSSIDFLNSEIFNICDSLNKTGYLGYSISISVHTCYKELKKNPNLGILRQKYLADYLIKYSICNCPITINPIEVEFYPRSSCHKSGVSISFLKHN